MPHLPPLDVSVHALAQTLFHFLWQGFLLASLAICILQTIEKRPQSRYIVYLSLLLALAACPLATLAVVDTCASSIAVASCDDGEIGAEVQPGAL